MSLAEDIRDDTPVAALGGNAPLLEMAGRITPDKLRTLQRILAAATEELAKRLQELAGLEFRIRLADLRVARPATLELSAQNSAVATYDAAGAGEAAGFVLDRGALDLFVETLLGGGAPGRAPAGERPVSGFDLAIAGLAVDHFAEVLQEAFAGALPFAIRPGPLQSGEHVELFVALEEEAVIASLALVAAGEEGEMHVLLPTPVAASLRPCRLQAAGRRPDPHWQQIMDARLRATAVTCAAVLDGGDMRLSEIAGLNEGDVLWLKTPPDARARFTCDGETLFTGELGQSEGFFTIRIEEEEASTRAFLEEMAQRRMLGERS
jgi:flagellar motor switch protein FliM